MPDSSPDWLEIGKIIAPQGLKGEVRVYSETDFPERLEQPGERWLQWPNVPEPQLVKLVRGRYLPQKGLYVVQLAEITNRNQAEALKGCRLLVRASDRPSLEAGEFHILDLIGLEVFNQHTQAIVGSVVSVVPAGNDLLEVKTSSRATVLIPFVKEIVPVVNLENKRVEITPPLDLLDVTEAPTKEA